MNNRHIYFPCIYGFALQNRGDEVPWMNTLCKYILVYSAEIDEIIGIVVHKYIGHIRYMNNIALYEYIVTSYI